MKAEHHMMAVEYPCNVHEPAAMLLRNQNGGTMSIADAGEVLNFR